jgi:hypothetical protein
MALEFKEPDEMGICKVQVVIRIPETRWKLSQT